MKTLLNYFLYLTSTSFYVALTSSSLTPSQLRNIHKPHSFLFKVKPARKVTPSILLSLLTHPSPTPSFHRQELQKRTDAHSPYFPTSHWSLALSLTPASTSLKSYELKVSNDLTMKCKGYFFTRIHEDLFATPGSADCIPEFAPPPSPLPVLWPPTHRVFLSHTSM